MIKVSAQEQFKVKGAILDVTLDLPLGNAVISILNSKDSTLVNFIRANKDGSFVINDLDTGDYILMASYPKYTDFVENFNLDSTQTTFDIGKVNMLLISQLLQDVVITAKNAIVIKGDTIEYDASKYTIEPNSKVEDLLSQLPGIQVDKDGKITAQGQAVNKVLVDGEEFFGDDPTLVTKNIRGDMVDKVQLYDKKSDQATFTGIDDGEKTKTINIQLKEGSKNGMFGKVDGGLATNDLYQGQAMFNKFNGLQKFAAYGTIGNTGKIGLNWQDNDKYASSEDIQISGSSIMIMSSGSRDELDSFSGQYNGQGIPLVQSGGLHYDTKWNDKKESINANYKIGALVVKGFRNVLSQNNLPTGVLESNSHQDFNDHMFRQKLDTRYEIAFDSTSTLKVSIDGTLKNSRSTNHYESSTVNGSNELLNTSARQTNNEGDSRNFKATGLWNKRLPKKGRTLSLNIEQYINRDDREGFLNSQNEYYGNQGVLDSTQLISQRKMNTIESSVFSSNIAYTEPLLESLTLAFNYRFNLNNGKSNLLSYNQSVNGEYNDLDSLYSNKFDLEQISNQVGTTLNYNKEKNTISLGVSAANVNFKQIDHFHNETIKRSFVNWNPNARWSHKFSAQKSFSLNYYGNTNQPSLSQIQPVRENQDPLNIVVGNPDLDPSFRSSISGSYYSYKVLTGRYFNFYLNSSFTSNAIVSNVSTDAVGKSIYKYENLTNHMPLNYSAYVYYGSKITGIDLNIGGNLDYSSNSYFNMTNDELNKTQSDAMSFQLDVRKQIQKKYSFYFSAGPSYTTSTASLQKELSNEGWGFNANGSANVFLPGKFELYSNANYMYTQATQVFDDSFERLIWNGGLRKKFFKTDELIFTFHVNDLLNQNVGFNRNTFNNVNTESNYTTIKRYFMFSLTWDFNKMGGN
jgi:hypothetical protein